MAILHLALGRTARAIKSSSRSRLQLGAPPGALFRNLSTFAIAGFRYDQSPIVATPKTRYKSPMICGFPVRDKVCYGFRDQRVPVGFA